MSNWIENEQQIIEKERKSKWNRDFSNKRMAMFLFLVMFIAGLQYAQGDELLKCPYCESIILLESPRAREIPGAGWYCDNCGMFQCHGTRCSYCKHPRK